MRHGPQDSPYKFFLENLLCGGLAGSSTYCFVYPLDLIRTRLGTDIGRQKH